eukprot:TRINITY_DN23241_c0_g2_i1.p1 TRINITY_DN23241_c0_g2~~TRINITY_DN23241_c0_g2_i1.p1  ORF type:complete len:131 (+),score=13.96 TRINITY_DN23241_c0_g2_i1:195-587(+)
MGNLELLDFFTDGHQVAQAWLCDSELHENWVASFQKSHLPGFVTTVVDEHHMYGLMAASQVAALLSSCFWLLALPKEVPLILSSMAGIVGYDVAFATDTNLHVIKKWYGFRASFYLRPCLACICRRLSSA